MANAMFAIAALTADDVHADDVKGLMGKCSAHRHCARCDLSRRAAGNKFYVGCILLCVVKTSYALSMSVGQARKGVDIYLSACSYRYGKEVLSSLAVGSFEKYFALDLSNHPVGHVTLSLVELPTLRNYIANFTGGLKTRAREILESYDSERCHNRSIARIGVDNFVQTNSAANMAFASIADIPLVTDIFAKWESALLYAANSSGDFSGIRLLGLIYDDRLLERVLSTSRVTWDAPESHAAFQSVQRYSLAKDGCSVFNDAPRTNQCIAKARIAVLLPQLVEGAEVAAFLATAEAQFADLRFQVIGVDLPLSLVCSICAWHLEANDQATAYAKSELAGNLNPLKQTLAQMHLAAHLYT
jgi:hypothetical protein